jgi:alkylated DNA nucleotide flippase Atl1
MSKSVEQEITDFLNGGQPIGWRVTAVEVICNIPAGKLASYGQISRKVAQESGHRIAPRTIGWLRSRLYEIYRTAEVKPEERSIPLHRIAVQGDVVSWWDSDKTRAENALLRGNEGFSTRSAWVSEHEL